LNDEIIEEFECSYLDRCYAGRNTTLHYTPDVKLFSRWCQKPIAEVTPQDADSYVGNELARGLSKATINRRLAWLRHLR
jgi:site-specific recombinase XerD